MLINLLGDAGEDAANPTPGADENDGGNEGGEGEEAPAAPAEGDSADGGDGEAPAA